MDIAIWFGLILSEARKWRLSLVAANQHFAQLSDSLQHAIFGNTSTIVAFRIGALDAPSLATELDMQGLRMIHSPIGTIIPISSAIGINSLGAMSPALDDAIE